MNVPVWYLMFPQIPDFVFVLLLLVLFVFVLSYIIRMICLYSVKCSRQLLLLSLWSQTGNEFTVSTPSKVSSFMISS